ncbi:MAG: hypothetical protein JW810_12980 [Sedimentisphaerales bacterium]|nr:hypothetical protein [Sedimentisphaerales bacterium]
MKQVSLGLLVWAVCFGAAAPGSGAAEGAYDFSGTISRPVLENYLARAITMADMLNGERVEDSLHGSVRENLRFIDRVGAKFIGRALFMWGGEERLEGLLTRARPLAEQVHAQDPQVILQAAVFEIITDQVNQIPVPAEVLAQFGQEPRERNFRCAEMVYPEGMGRAPWGPNAFVPDMSRLETRMWFYYLACRYIDIGVEAIHFGQVEIMDQRDPNHVHWRDMLRRVRQYAGRNARRNMVLCDAHVPSGGIAPEGRLLFDFHSFPLRIEEVPDQPGLGVLQVGYLDSIFGRSRGGAAPSGWRCEHLPYLVELDNWGSSRRGGQNIDGCWCWGYDEICWFAHQPQEYRNQWLRYAWKWVRQTDANGFLQMPAGRVLADPVGPVRWYWGHRPSDAVPHGFNQEETIRSIWLSPYCPTDNYDERRIEGWLVRVNRELSLIHPELCEKVLRLLDQQLYQIARAVPAAALARLREMTIWVEYRDRQFACMCYHPSRAWLTENGYNPDKEKSVEIANAENFLKWTHDQPWMVLHELAHGYHHQVLGYENREIRRAYEAARKAGRYESVLHINGRRQRHYALNNDQEYFAEATEAYFGTNDFYPFVRAELKQHDPELFGLMEKLWGQ